MFKLIVKVVISITLDKHQTHQIIVYSCIPCPGFLLKIVQGFLQFANMGLIPIDYKPCSFSMYTYFSVTTFKKEVFTSIWCNFQPITEVIEIMVLIEVYLATRENVFS
jgi:hypothetical protein